MEMHFAWAAQPLAASVMVSCALSAQGDERAGMEQPGIKGLAQLQCSARGVRESSRCNRGIA